MTTIAVATYLRMLDLAYRSDPSGHGLYENIASVPDEAWDARPLGVARSIRDMVFHVAECKLAYEAYAFGDASWRCELAMGRENGLESRESLMPWLDTGHRLLAGSVAQLTDSDLDEPRLTTWGELVPARRIIEIMIAHDHYHAGEINHLRSSMGEDDRWAYVIDP